MNLIICDSKGWFEVNPELKRNNKILIISQREELNLNKIDIFKPTYIFFIHWNWIVDEKIFSKYDCILFHTSPLPYGRGGSPIQNLIIRGFKESPVCALKMNREIDAGPIYLKTSLSLEGLAEEIYIRSAKLVFQMIETIIVNMNLVLLAIHL